MGRFFILLGVVLLLLGGAFFLSFSQVEQPPPPTIEGISPGAIDTVPIDPAVLNAAIDEANAIANAANAKGIDLSRIVAAAPDRSLHLRCLHLHCGGPAENLEEPRTR